MKCFTIDYLYDEIKTLKSVINNDLFSKYDAILWGKIYFSFRFGLANVINDCLRLKILVVFVENFYIKWLLIELFIPNLSFIYLCIPEIFKTDLKITIFAIDSPFLLPYFLRGKRKEEKNDHSCDFKSCLSSRSLKRTFKSGFWVKNHPLNLCSHAVNLQRLFRSQKGGIKRFVLKLSGKNQFIFS